MKVFDDFRLKTILILQKSFQLENHFFQFLKKIQVKNVFSFSITIQCCNFIFYQVLDPTFLPQIVLDYLRLGRFSLMLFFFHCILLQEVLVAPLLSNLVTRSSPIVNKNQFNFWYNVPCKARTKVEAMLPRKKI